jgi:hypothetical protein
VSIALPAVSLANVVLGQKGTISLQNAGIDANPSRYNTPAHIALHNESGIGLIIAFSVSGSSFHLPAGGWLPIALDPGEGQITWTVEYILNVIGGAPVSQLLVTYYQPHEAVPAIPQLGNSPIGGAVSTSSIQTLSQEGVASGLLTIDIGDLTFSQLISIFNNGQLAWSVDQSGVKHQALKINTAGTPLQLGQAGDLAEFLGQLIVDQASEFVGNVLMDGNVHVAGTSALDGDITQLGATNSLLPPVSQSGSVAGSVNLYEVIYGHTVIIFISEIGFNTAANRDLVLPHSLSNFAWFLTSGNGTAGTGGLQALLATVAQNFFIMTTFAAAGGTVAAPQTSLFGQSLGFTNTPFDTIRFLPTGGNVRTSSTIIIGN